MTNRYFIGTCLRKTRRLSWNNGKRHGVLHTDSFNFQRNRSRFKICNHHWKKSCSLFSRDIAFGIHWGRLNSRSINCSKQLISLITIMFTVAINCGRRDGVMVRALVSGSSCCSSHCDGFLGKTLYSRFTSLHVLTGDFNAIGNLALDEHHIQGNAEILVTCYIAMGDKRRINGPLGSYTDFTFFTFGQLTICKVEYWSEQ